MAAFSEFPPVLQAFVTTGFTWLMTAIGGLAAEVLHAPSRHVLDGMRLKLAD